MNRRIIIFTVVILCCCLLVVKTDEDEDDDHDSPGTEEEDHDVSGTEGDHDGGEPTVVPKGYDKTETGLHGTALDVGLNVYVESIIRIDITAMEFSVRCYIIHEWKDMRLARERHHAVIRIDASPFWVPDTYCLNCRESTIGENSRQLIRIDTTGDVYFSQLSQLYASCIMNLERFPFDVQACKIQFGSYSLNDSYINFYWHDGLRIERMVLDQFTVRNKSIMSSKVVVYQQGNFTVLEAEVYFERQMGFYIMQFMVPSVCLVFLSWVTLYMSPTDVGDRVAIGVTLILTMIFMLGYVNNNLPKVAYVKAIDWFLIVSLAMIILSVLESAIVYWVYNKKQKSKVSTPKKMKGYTPTFAKYTDQLRYLNPNSQVSITISDNDEKNQYNDKRHMHKRRGTSSFSKRRASIKKVLHEAKLTPPKKLSKIDNIARCVLPLGYILYTLIYLYTYSQDSEPELIHT